MLSSGPAVSPSMSPLIPVVQVVTTPAGVIRPMSPGGTVALQATAHLAGGEILQTLLTYVRDPIVFTRAYGYKLDYSYVSDAEGEMASLTETYHYDVQWTRGGGGTSLETWSAVPYDTAEDVHSSQTVTVWPADNGYWPFLPGQQVINYYCNGELTESDTNTVGAPSVEWMEQSDRKSTRLNSSH